MSAAGDARALGRVRPGKIEAIFKRFDFAAEVVVETSDQKTADLRVSDPSGGAYLVEVKGRLGSNFEGQFIDLEVPVAHLGARCSGGL